VELSKTKSPIDHMTSGLRGTS